ncbi:MAG: DUF169 domain-containing protein [Bacteroidales bacterium]|nr:DUF169 domain-containing protein [Bacteroidales bacterium]
MKTETKEKFTALWKKYFGETELPITFYYSKEINNVKLSALSKDWNCLICKLSKVRNGESLAYNIENIACFGAKRYLGFIEGTRPKFEYFLSCGIPGEMEGERYIRTPEMVLELQKNQKRITDAIGNYIIFKRWDKLEESDNPAVVIFFAKPDVLSGLFTLANFDQTEPNSTFTPFGAGCGTIVHYPYLEKDKERPRAIIGMFDPSARPCVPKDTLSFAVPMIKFEKMIDYMEECFLITDTWKTVKKRIEG